MDDRVEPLRASRRALATCNPIRSLIQSVGVDPPPDKDVIRLSVGDPTVSGHLRPPDGLVDELVRELGSGTDKSGYPSSSAGLLSARQAVGQIALNPPLPPENVFLAAGASGALEMAMASVADVGDGVLVPKPGFPLFRTHAASLGLECLDYAMLPDTEWQVDLSSVARVVAQARPATRVAAILINNPSNPSGSVFSEQHIQDIIVLAERLQLTIIADEIYARMIFPSAGRPFISMAQVASNAQAEVLVLTVGGLSKTMLVPGWRIGWVAVHDTPTRAAQTAGILSAILNMTTRMIALPATPVQSTVCRKDILQSLYADHVPQLMKTLESASNLCIAMLTDVPGLQIMRPLGAMYMMVSLGEDDIAFTRDLMAEEAVFVLPGSCFGAPNFVRIVLCLPEDILREACQRIASFCKHRVQARL